MEKIGFIGLGVMGKPMAKNLLKAGYSLMVYDIVPEFVKEIVDAGAQEAGSSKEAAAFGDVVITMLPNSPQVKEVVLGPGGVLEGAKPGTILVDMSSIAPLASQEVSAKAQEKGRDYAGRAGKRRRTKSRRRHAGDYGGRAGRRL